ncbi:hypothetical protein [Sulfurimonas sp. CS5]|uniref:hypothetical protein n=1 Tax=Sulfurimonas sp. CS5 TaxID=3391145 RepID=UPI0039E939C8
MKSLAYRLTLVITTILFSACSNMQIGFEEDSPFYTPPSEKNLEPKETVEKITPKKEIIEESETSFSYSREDDY